MNADGLVVCGEALKEQTELPLMHCASSDATLVPSLFASVRFNAAVRNPLAMTCTLTLLTGCLSKPHDSAWAKKWSRPRALVVIACLFQSSEKMPSLSHAGGTHAITFIAQAR